LPGRVFIDDHFAPAFDTSKATALQPHAPAIGTGLDIHAFILDTSKD
jgi:hypothetical protein